MNHPMRNPTNFATTARRKREAERSVNWTVEETRVLLCAWSDVGVQKSLAENLRNRHVFKHLSAHMSEMGFSRSPHQCRLRVKTLKANYVRAKLQKTVDSSQPCTFKYFADMDAVLGRRSTGGKGGPYFVSPERMADHQLNYIDRTGCVLPDFNSNTEISEPHIVSLARSDRHLSGTIEERDSRQSWQLGSEIKLEDREDLTDSFESSNAGFPQHPEDRHPQVHPESSIHREISGTLAENSLSTPSPPPVPPLPFPSYSPHTQCTASPGTAPPDPSPNTPPPSDLLYPESACLEPILKHLSECFQRLVSDTRGLLEQLESQRQEQARWNQGLLAQWLQRDERRQREMAEREERREKARMEHEIRVLELLTSLARQHRCKCGDGQTVEETPAGQNHTIN